MLKCGSIWYLCFLSITVHLSVTWLHGAGWTGAQFCRLIIKVYSFAVEEAQSGRLCKVVSLYAAKVQYSANKKYQSTACCILVWAPNCLIWKIIPTVLYCILIPGSVLESAVDNIVANKRLKEVRSRTHLCFIPLEISKYPEASLLLP